MMTNEQLYQAECAAGAMQHLLKRARRDAAARRAASIETAEAQLERIAHLMGYKIERKVAA